LFWELIQANPRTQHGAPCPPGQTRMKYDGTFAKEVIPHLNAKLGARKKSWDLPTEAITEKLTGVID